MNDDPIINSHLLQLNIDDTDIDLESDSDSSSIDSDIKVDGTEQ
ncbi:unnamed protein product, partial [Rotaria sp. Silwood2]